ncbi:MAG: pyridoxamine kinase [Acutalibacteraceae bacterium]|nr:pyridoxamine kinase [Acutalibacteraceae bacterium]
MKKIVTVQDISCVGKCSLTVALPIISAMGVEASVIPTAVLSGHTAFPEFTFCDLTNQIEPITKTWKNLGITFDAIYTGYLGSVEQIELMYKLFDDFKTDENIVIVDPAMADYGNLYKGFTQSFVDKMTSLCGKADVIVPNLTEACYMLGIPYIGDDYDKAVIQQILVSLSKQGCKYCVLTGVSLQRDKFGVMAYNSETAEFFEYYTEKLPNSFHGTGDIFASAFTGALMQNGINKEEALKIAVDFTVDCIKATLDNKDYHWYGVDFETAMPKLINRLRELRG